MVAGSIDLDGCASQPVETAAARECAECEADLYVEWVRATHL